MTTESQIVIPVLEVLAGAPGGRLPTGTVRQLVKDRIRLSAKDLAPLHNRPDRKIDQTIRNLKSHKKVPGNPFHEGLIEDVPRAYSITAKGLKSLRGSA